MKDSNDDLRLEILQALDDGQSKDAWRALLSLVRHHAQPFSLHRDLRDFDEDARAADMRFDSPRAQRQLVDAVSRRIMAALDASVQDAAPGALGLDASKTLLWLGEHTQDADLHGADTSTRWLIQAVHADPTHEQALLTYVDQVFASSYATSWPTLFSIADALPDTTSDLAHRLRLLHTLTTHTICAPHGDTFAHDVLVAARAAHERGAHASHWASMLAWLDASSYPPYSDTIGADWFTRWLEA